MCMCAHVCICRGGGGERDGEREKKRDRESLFWLHKSQVDICNCSLCEPTSKKHLCTPCIQLARPPLALFAKAIIFYS